MKAIIAIICRDQDSMKLFYFPSIHQTKMNDCKRNSICYLKYDNQDDARNHITLDLIEEKHISRERRDLILLGKLYEIDVRGLNISIRTGLEMTSFIKYYNRLV